MASPGSFSSPSAPARSFSMRRAQASLARSEARSKLNPTATSDSTTRFWMAAMAWAHRSETSATGRPGTRAPTADSPGPLSSTRGTSLGVMHQERTTAPNISRRNCRWSRRPHHTHMPGRNGGSAGKAKRSGYDEFKEFQGKRYTGMKVGRRHKWKYDPGEWNETKVTPDKWEFRFA